jgi:hypothetical protein
MSHNVTWTNPAAYATHIEVLRGATNPPSSVVATVAVGTLGASQSTTVAGGARTDYVAVRAVNQTPDPDVSSSLSNVLRANQVPTVGTVIPDQTGIAGDSDAVLDLDTYFDDDGADTNLTYSIVGSPASASLSGTRNKTLTVSKAAAVTESVTIRATDAGGLTVDDTFTVTIAAGSTIVFNDLFVQASNPELSTHTPDIGAAWVKIGSSPDLTIVSASSAVRNPSSAAAGRYRAPTAITTETYDVEATVAQSSSQPFAAVGIYGRLEASGTNSQVERLAFMYDVGAGGWTLELKDYGAALTSSGAWPGGDVAMKLKVTPTRVEGWANGVLKLAIDSAIGSATGRFAGLVNMNWSNSTEAFLIKDFKVTRYP